jgi:hypothetical protein
MPFRLDMAFLPVPQSGTAAALPMRAGTLVHLRPVAMEGDGPKEAVASPQPIVRMRPLVSRRRQPFSSSRLGSALMASQRRPPGPYFAFRDLSTLGLESAERVRDSIQEVLAKAAGHGALLAGATMGPLLELAEWAMEELSSLAVEVWELVLRVCKAVDATRSEALWDATWSRVDPPVTERFRSLLEAFEQAVKIVRRRRQVLVRRSEELLAAATSSASSAATERLCVELPARLLAHAIQFLEGALAVARAGLAAFRARIDGLDGRLRFAGPRRGTWDTWRELSELAHITEQSTHVLGLGLLDNAVRLRAGIDGAVDDILGAHCEPAQGSRLRCLLS